MLFDDDFEKDNDIPGVGSAGVDESSASGLLPPREMADIVGHEDVESYLLTLFAGERPPQALIFSGPEGIGKTTMAFRLARFLLSRPAASALPSSAGLFGEMLPAPPPPSTMFLDPAAPVFRQVAAGGHADLLTIERPFDEKKGRRQSGVPVEEARRVAPFLQMTSSEGGWRVVIIDDADTMNRNAQNALLKILEEPPARSLLILVAHRTGALLPTIRSRCRVVPFRAPPRDCFRDLIGQDHPGLSASDTAFLYDLTRGSPGRALHHLKAGGPDLAATLVGLLAALPRPDWVAVHGLADLLSRPGQEDAARCFEDLVMWFTDAILRHKAAGQPLPALMNRDDVRRLAAGRSLNDWIEAREALYSHFQTADRANLDRRQAVMGVFTILGLSQQAA